MASLADLRKLNEKVKKDYEHSIVKANSNTLKNKISFDSPQLTYMFSGFSYDRIHQIFGPESAGKSSVSTYIAGQLQKKMPEEIERRYNKMKSTDETWRGLDAEAFKKKFENKSVVVYLDFERTFDPEYATQLGMNCDEDHLILLQPDTLEDAAKMAIDYMKLGLVCCVVLDSDAMATTNLDLESDPGDTGFGGAKGANVLKQVYKNMNLQCSNYLTPLIILSQERDNMNVLSHLPACTGGRAVRFAASTRQRITKLETLSNGKEDAGIQIRVRNYKNKTGVPWRDAILNLYFEGGFKVDDEYFGFLALFDIIHKGNGGVYTADFLPNGKIRGEANVKEWITAPEQKELYDKLKEQVMEKLLRKNEQDANNVKVDENGVAETDKVEVSPDDLDLMVNSEESTNPEEVGL